MRAQLLDKEVLAMYDVRGIQSYIFKTNKAKEIVGASVLVANIITDGLEEYKKTLGNVERSAYMTDWQNDDPVRFINDSSVEMQVMFIGGGNAYVLFRHGAVCQKVNRFLAKYVLEATYSLNLAVAVIEKTESYHADYNHINDEMRRIKAYMPLAQPVGAMPFMAVDSITGYPLTYMENNKYYCTESKLKRQAFPKNESEKVFDDMVTKKGDNSLLAVCHIDGNSMGKRIKRIMGGEGGEHKVIESYGEAIITMRKLSREIADTFRHTFDEMTGYMDSLSAKIKKTQHKLYREIIVAGDDITFVCNPKLAIPAVRYFLENIGNHGEYSACGGVAFFNSHFPFSDAYQVAEECCGSAKKRAKQKENRGTDDEIGNFFDYQMCSNIRAADLSNYRDRQYRSDAGSFVARPYYVPAKNDPYRLNEKNEKYNISRFDEWTGEILSMPRSKAKQLRDVITMGKNAMDEYVSFLESRGYGRYSVNKDQYPVWYDVLEIMDLIMEGGDENETCDRAFE